MALHKPELARLVWRGRTARCRCPATAVRNRVTLGPNLGSWTPGGTPGGNV